MSYLKNLSITIIAFFVFSNQGYSQCSASCGADSAGPGESSCVDVGVPKVKMELGIDAINGHPTLSSYLSGNTLVNKLDNCCGNDNDCVSIYFSLDGGGAYSLEEINAIGSGSVYIDCVDLSANFDQVIPYSVGTYELVFCPPGGSGSKRIGFAPLYEIQATVTDETIAGADDGSISVSYSLGNPNVSPSGTTMYSIDGIGGSTSNTTGEFNDLADGTYTVYVYDSANTGNYNTIDLVVGEGVNCDLQNPAEDCDSDGVLNGDDCDPLDPSVLGVGSSCTASDSSSGTIDENCFCIASSGSTSSGGDGGLESNNKWSNIIAKRNHRMKTQNAKLYRDLVTGEIPFLHRETVEKSSVLDIRDLIPQNLWNAHVAESTPLGLTDISNAVDVVAADYYLNDIRQAVALIIKSEDGVYEHSKYICDRMEGAELMELSEVAILNMKFILFKIKNTDGGIEYAVSFSGYQKLGGFKIENHWNLNSYTWNEDYYNFQIWASSVEKVQSLATSIINKIGQQVALNGIHCTSHPNVFVKQGHYENGNLILNVMNTGEETQIEMRSNLQSIENGTESLLGFVLNVPGFTEYEYVIPTEGLYTIGLNLTDAEGYSDDLFFADGNWGVEDNAGHGEILKVEIFQQEEFYGEEVRQIERGIEVEANVKDYQNIYRSLTPKWDGQDLSSYNTMSFEASGQGKVEITFVSESESDWSKQVRQTLTLSEEKEMYHLSFDQMSNYDSSDDVRDIFMIVISMIGNNEEFEYKKLTMENVLLQNMQLSSVASLTGTEEVNFYPNPATDVLNIDHQGGTIHELKILQVTGQVVASYGGSKNDDIKMVDISQLTEGLYYIKTIDDTSETRISSFVKY